MRTRPNSAPAAADDDDATPFTGPLLVWLGVQLAVIALAAARVPLAAQYVEPAEHLALHLVLGVQVVVVSLLFPLLLRDVRSVTQIVATAIPFQLAAAYLAGHGVNNVFQPAGFVGAWVVTLAVWATCLRSIPAQVLGVAVASFLTLGLATSRYLRLEFSASQHPDATFESASPLLTTWAAITDSSTLWGWVTVGSLMTAGLCILGITRRTSRPVRHHI
jgi:glycerol uptake facilitator-like aquaporin